MNLLETLRQPWPWYVAGPLIGLTVPTLLLLGNKVFGLSSNLRHLCAMFVTTTLPASRRAAFFSYDWRTQRWNLIFALGIILGGFSGGVLLANPEPLRVAASTQRDLATLGVATDGTLAPTALFSWHSLLSPRGFLLMVGGGFLVGFGTRYAGGCTSGHAISGLSNLQVPSLIAVIGFFVGGLLGTHLLLPLILGR